MAANPESRSGENSYSTSGFQVRAEEARPGMTGQTKKAGLAAGLSDLV
jgi:hypothetical protein